jgi:hypothetical protein
VLTIAGEGERTYIFGNLVPDSKGRNVYARSSVSGDYVFEVPVGKPDLITQGQLTVSLLYHVEPSNVKSLKLRGWSESSTKGVSQELELERKPGGVWSAKGDFPLDGTKAEALLAAIASPRAEATIIEKTGPRPEHGLDVAKGALEITIVPIQGQPITLTLGNVLNKESNILLAATDQAKGDVYTLQSKLLVDLKEKPAVLKKPEEKK